MTTQRFAILEHTTTDGVHHDLLVDDPNFANAQGEEARLWTARIQPPPAQWAKLGRIRLTPLPHHRSHYLTYEGPISDDRGSVRRVAEGMAEVPRWETEAKALRLPLAGQNVTLTITSGPVDGLTAFVTLAP